MLLAGLVAVAAAATPVIVIEHPLAGSSTNDQLLPFSGTTNDTLDSIVLKIHEGASTGKVLQTLTTATPLLGTWETAPQSPLAEGEYTAVAEQTSLGEIGSAEVAFTVDTTPPAVTLTALPKLVNSSTATFGGYAGTETGDLPPVTLKIYTGASATGSPAQTIPVTPAGGTWTAEAGLADGTYTAIAEQTDKAGNTRVTTTTTFTIDTASPEVSLNALPAFVNTDTPTFSGRAGTAEFDFPIVTLKIYAGTGTTGTLRQTLEATAKGGSWSVTPTKALTDGTYTAIAEQSNEAGTTGRSSTSTFTVDTGSPQVSLNPVPSPTNNPTPHFSGNAGTAEFDSATVTVKVYAGTGTGGGLVQTLEAKQSGGSWGVTPASPLGDGTFTAVAEQSNKAGTTGVSSTSTFVVDTTSPSVTLNPLPAFVNTSNPTFSGAAGSEPRDIPIITVRIYAGADTSGSLEQTLLAKASAGSWAVTVTKALAEGTYTASAEQSDEAGNTRVNGTNTFTVDPTLPKVTLKPLPTASKNATPAFTGTAGTGPNDLATVLLKIYPGASVTGIPVQTLETKASAGSWSIGPIAALPEGTYTGVAEQSNKAGQTGQSIPSTFTILIFPPEVTLNLLPPVTNHATPTFSGSATSTAEHALPAVKVKIYAGTQASGALVQTLETKTTRIAWSVTPTTKLADGTYTAIAEQSDEAGNIGVSNTTTFKVDTSGPNVTLNALPIWIDTGMPSFSGNAGSASGDRAVAVKVHLGTETGPIVASVEASKNGGSWTATLTEPIPDGTYTAVAEQSDEAHVGISEPRTFTVVTTPPPVTITTPAEGSVITASGENVTGTAGTMKGLDRPVVTIQLFAGSSVSAPEVENHTVGAAGGSWWTAFAGLTPGTYTVRAAQLDEAGNEGTSARTFTVVSPSPRPAAPVAPPKPAPVASFTWLPSAPHVGEPVTLVSNSSDAAEAIAALAWNAADIFNPGGPVYTTSFAKPGAYPVQLRVTSAAGLSSVASRTIDVTPVPILLMEPFPVVRIAGSESRGGVKLSLITVLAPPGARVVVVCRGPGCPTRSKQSLAASRGSKKKTGMGPIELRRFERSLRPGAVLEIRIFETGVIGKYMRFTVRRGKLPTRVDACLDATGVKPIACPPA
jgi:hypothetical protein